MLQCSESWILLCLVAQGFFCPLEALFQKIHVTNSTCSRLSNSLSPVKNLIPFSNERQYPRASAVDNFFFLCWYRNSLDFLMTLNCIPMAYGAYLSRISPATSGPYSLRMAYVSKNKCYSFHNSSSTSFIIFEVGFFQSLSTPKVSANTLDFSSKKTLIF